MPPIKKKPVAGEATGLLEIETLPGKFDNQKDSPATLQLQSASLRQRFNMSWPVARLVAELHFGGAA